jgi:AraC-like DNA-binding protein
MIAQAFSTGSTHTMERSFRNMNGIANNNGNIASLIEKLCSDVVLKAANYLERKPGISTRLHIHTDILHITYTLRGKGTLLLGKKEYAIDSRSFHFVFPNEPHAFIADINDPWVNFIVKIQFSGILPFLFPRIINQIENTHKIERILKDLNKIFYSPPTLSKQVRETAKLLELFAELMDAPDDSHGDNIPKAAGVPFFESLRTIQNPPFPFPGLFELAKTNGMSVRAFTRMFRKITGSSPLQFNLDSKMSHAKIFLDSENNSVKEVATICGYSNSQNFIRAYKKHFGYCPLKSVFSSQNQKVHSEARGKS